MNGTTWSLAAIEQQGRDVAVALLPTGAIVSIGVLPEGISPLLGSLKNTIREIERPA